MHKSTLARCTITTEALRRHNQRERDNTTRPPLADVTRRASFAGFSVGSDRAASAHSEQPGDTHLSMLTSPGQVAVSGDIAGDYPAESLGNAAHSHRPHDSAAQLRRSNMWSPGLNAHRKSGSICAVLRREPEHPARGAYSEPAAQKPPPLDPAQTWLSEAPEDEHEDTAPPGAYRCLITQWDEDAQEYRTSTEIRQYNSFALPRSLTADLWDSFSPSSDTTLFEDPAGYYSDSGDSTDAFFSLDKSDGHPAVTAHAVQAAVGKEGSTTPVPRPQLHHRRAVTTDVPPQTPRRASMPLRKRSKTNTGILELQLGKGPTSPPTTDRHAVKDPVTPAVARHSRKVSLGLPISISRPQANPQHSMQSPWSPSTPTIAERSERPERSERSEGANEIALVQEERELEYKHRHTFIGTASLDDFLEILEVSPTHTTTRASVAKAFIFLVSAEHLHARQCSIKSEGWDVVSRITTDSSKSDYIAQAQIKLGAVTLKQFLDLIPFDEKGEVGALSVVGAFSAGSHMDAKASAGVGSKAGQFRKWMVKQMGMTS